MNEIAAAEAGPIVPTYAAYVLISVALTVWVARTLSRNGRVFLVDVFRGSEELADSVNHLLVVGFYLLNLGFVCFHLRIAEDVATTRQAIEALSSKVGMVLIVLAGVHFLNLYVFSRIRRRGLLSQSPPPVPPTSWRGGSEDRPDATAGGAVPCEV